MASARGFAPCFPVRDMRAAVSHYRQLGFEVMAYTQGMTWAWVRLSAAELHLFVKDDHDPGAAGTSGPYDTPYGREFVHVDPDNNLMRFVAPAAARSEATATAS